MTPLWIFTQNIKPTQTQKNRISEIFSPEYIIESSRAISILIEQDSVIKARDIQIKELALKISALQDEHKKTLISIAKENKVAQTASKQIDSISEDQIKDSRFKFKNLKWLNLHLYTGLESDLNFKEFTINSELMYEFNKFHFGIKLDLQPITTEEKTQYNFNYFIKLRYRFF